MDEELKRWANLFRLRKFPEPKPVDTEKLLEGSNTKYKGRIKQLDVFLLALVHLLRLL